MEKHDDVLFYLRGLIKALEDQELAPDAYHNLDRIQSFIRKMVIEADESEFGRAVALEEFAA